MRAVFFGNFIKYPVDEESQQMRHMQDRERQRGGAGRASVCSKRPEVCACVRSDLKRKMILSSVLS